MNESDLEYLHNEFTKGSAAILKYRILLDKYGRHTSYCDFSLKPGGCCDCGWDYVEKSILGPNNKNTK